MKTVHKFLIDPESQIALLPVGARVLSVGFQGANLFLWAIVNSEEKRIHERRANVVGTGHPMPWDEGRFISTVFRGELVFHVFLDEPS